MQYRNDQHHAHCMDEPKVIAIAATRQALVPTWVWAAGLAVSAYVWWALSLG